MQNTLNIILPLFLETEGFLLSGKNTFFVLEKI